MVGSLTGAVSLLKSNGGVRRCAQNGRKSFKEYKGKSALNCETHKSSRYESRVLVIRWFCMEGPSLNG